MAGRDTVVRFKDERSGTDKVGAVLQQLHKDGPLSKKQVEFCNPACIERFLKARGNSVSKAAKHLKATLAWREGLDIGYLIADEFAAELAAGAAFVAGHDDQGRPVMVIRKKQESTVPRSQKKYLRFLVFTAEVALASMAPGVHQWVMIVDIAGVKKVSSSSVSSVFTTLKVLAEHYPERLARAFIVDASSVFHFFWKGISPFLDHGVKEKLSFVYSKGYIARDSVKVSGVSSTVTSPFVTGRSQRFNPSEDFPHMELENLEGSGSLAPLTPGSRVNGAALISSVHARSYSFSNPASAPKLTERMEVDSRSFRIDTKSKAFGSPFVASTKPRKGRNPSAWDSFVPRLRKEDRSSGEDAVIQFGPYLKFYQTVYNQASYRGLMKPPLGGLASLVSPELKRKSTSFESHLSNIQLA